MGTRGKRNIIRYDPQLIDERFIKDFNYLPFDRKVIELVYKMRAISTSQITRITGYNANYVRRELTNLYFHRFLDRVYPYEQKVIENNNLGSVQGIYFIDEAGRVALSGFLDSELKYIKWKPIENLVKYEKLKHTIECSEILAKVYEESKKAGYSVLDYASEKFLWKKFNYQNTKYEFCPDMYLKIMKDKYAYSFFIENDEATMDVRSFLTKVPKYDNFKLSGIYEEEYDIYPRVLVITTSKDRALTLAREVGKKQKSKVEFLFTWHDAFYELPFGSNTFIHTSVDMLPRTYSMFDEIPEEAKIGFIETEEIIEKRGDE